MIANEDEARSFCAERVPASGLSKLSLFGKMLVDENGRQNLVSATSLATVWQRHFADSLQLLDYAPSEEPWLDLGSGAGFPGIPLAIARPDIPITLVESRRRRVEWLEKTVAELGLVNVAVAGSRLESIAPFAAGMISARAFAPLGKLLRLASRFSTLSTTWLLPKGRSAAQEHSEQIPSIQAMFHVEQSVTDPSGGILVGKGIPNLP